MWLIRFLRRLKDRSYYALEIFIWRITYDFIIFGYLYVILARGNIDIAEEG